MRWWIVAVIGCAAGACSLVTNTDPSDLDPAPARDSGQAPETTIDTGMDAEPDSATPEPDSAAPETSAPDVVEVDTAQPEPEIRCGPEMSCEADEEVCCFTSNEPPQCRSSAEECRCEGILCESIPAACDSSADCPGSQQCCAIRGIADPTPDRIVCKDACEDGTIRREEEICNPLDPQCRNGNACERYDRLPGLGYCRRR